jgi:serine/threonine protein kinase
LWKDAAPTALRPSKGEVSTPEGMRRFATKVAAAHAQIREVRNTAEVIAMSTHTVAIDPGEGGRLVVKQKHTGDCNDISSLAVPLHLAEVVTCRLTHDEADACCNLIVIGQREAAADECSDADHDDSCPEAPFIELWLVVAASGSENDELALNYTLTCLGNAGAVRTDLFSAFDVSAKPSGCGSRSKVYMASVSTGGAGLKVATKFLDARDSCKEASLLLAAQRHPNIVGFYGLFGAPSGRFGCLHSALILEWCPGTLQKLLDSGSCSETYAAELLYALLSGLSHLHSRGLVHRSVKTDNVLIAELDRPVLSNFGMACNVNDREAMSRRCKSPGYSAPEMLSGRRYTEKIDVFSTGVLVYFALSSALPFSGPDIGSILRRTLRTEVNFKSKQFDSVSQSMKCLIAALLQRDPDQRPSSISAVRDTWETYGAHLATRPWMSFRPTTPMEVVHNAWVTGHGDGASAAVYGVQPSLASVVQRDQWTSSLCKDAQSVVTESTLLPNDGLESAGCWTRQTTPESASSGAEDMLVALDVQGKENREQWLSRPAGGDLMDVSPAAPPAPQPPTQRPSGVWRLPKSLGFRRRLHGCKKTGRFWNSMRSAVV